MHEDQGGSALLVSLEVLEKVFSLPSCAVAPQSCKTRIVKDLEEQRQTLCGHMALRFTWQVTIFGDPNARCNCLHAAALTSSTFEDAYSAPRETRSRFEANCKQTPLHTDDGTITCTKVCFTMTYNGKQFNGDIRGRRAAQRLCSRRQGPCARCRSPPFPKGGGTARRDETMQYSKVSTSTSRRRRTLWPEGAKKLQDHIKNDSVVDVEYGSSLQHEPKEACFRTRLMQNALSRHAAHNACRPARACIIASRADSP